jgi:hypothetical protein
MFKKFFTKDNPQGRVEPSAINCDEQHRDLIFAGCKATLDRISVDSIRLTILDSPFSAGEIQVAAQIISRGFSGLFEFDLEVSADDKAVDLHILKEGRGQPLKLKITLENIAIQLQQVSNDKGEPCFSDLHSSQEILRRYAAFESASDEQYPLLLARIQLEPMERAVHLCVGRLIGALTDAGKLNFLPIVIGIVDEALQEVSATAIEVVSKKYSGIEFAPVHDLSEEQINQIKSSQKVQLPTPPIQFAGNFVLVDAAVHRILRQLEDKRYLDLDEDACRIASSAIAKVYASFEEGGPSTL